VKRSVKFYRHKNRDFEPDMMRKFYCANTIRRASFDVADSNIIPEGLQRLAGGKLAPPPENANKS
jgi:hypothetical protein